VHGGVGFIEETGAAQYLRDARITPIYEGTTGIQANDLIGRKLARDGGRAARDVIDQMRTVVRELAAGPDPSPLAASLSSGIDSLERSVRYVVENYASDIRAVSVGAVPLLKLFGIVAGGWQLLRSASICRQRLADSRQKAGDAAVGDAAFYEAKIATAQFYADHVLSQASGLAHCIVHGAAGALTEGVL
jgi:plasmid stabilization system protein ParE